MSTLGTCKKFVAKILLSYKDSQVELLNLPAIQEMIWLIDCWSVHISKKIWKWIKNHYLKIHILYIPANCTNIYQYADIIFKRLFKHIFRQAFNKYTIEAITKQLMACEDVHMDFKMSKFKPHIYEWFYVAWANASNRITMILKDWEQSRLLRVFDNDFQKQVMLDNIKKTIIQDDWREGLGIQHKVQREDRCESVLRHCYGGWLDKCCWIVKVYFF